MTSEPSNEYQKLVEAAAKLVERFNGFMACNDGHMGNHEQAYQRLVKNAFVDWDSARAALSALKLPHAGDAMSEQNVQVTQALEPCLCGRPVNLFRFYKRASEEGAHINLDCSGFALDECPLNLSLTRDVRSEADVDAFLTAWNHRARAEPVCEGG